MTAEAGQGGPNPVDRDRVRGSCSAVSLELGEALAGTAPHTSGWLVVEHARAWGAKALFDSGMHHGTAQMLTALGDREGLRVQLCRRPDRPEAGTRRVFVARSEAGRQRLFEADIEDLSDLDPVPIDEPQPPWRRAARPLYLVCTNGRRDACCAVHGRAAFEAMRALAGDMVWETTHVGGHRFAANVVALPAGVCYGRVDAAAAEQIVLATQAGCVVPANCRGRSAIAPHEQAAELAIRDATGEVTLDGVRVESSVADGHGGWVVAAAASGARWRAAVVIEPALPARIESCGGQAVSPDAFVVRTLERLEPST